MAGIEETLFGWRDHVPTVVAAALLMLAGALLGWLARAGIRRAATAIGGGDASRARILGATGTVAFWVILAVFTVAALQLVREAQAPSWIDRLGDYVPSLIGGAAIIIAGTLLSVLARDLAVRSMSQFGIDQARILGRVVQLVVLVTAFVVGIGQLGIEVTFLAIMIAIIAGGCVLAVGLAFALGAVNLVRNLLAARDARRHYSPGQRVRVGDTEGELLEITATVMVLATPAGRVTLPARLFHELPVTLLAPVAADRG